MCIRDSIGAAHLIVGEEKAHVAHAQLVPGHAPTPGLEPRHLLAERTALPGPNPPSGEEGQKPLSSAPPLDGPDAERPPGA
eukprot:15049799-Alexandrium_andersonii.AAC.1